MYDKELTPEQIEAAERQAEALSEEARLNWDNPLWHSQMAAVLTTETLKGFEHTNVMDLLTDVRTYGEGDRVTVTEEVGLEVFQIARGGYIEESTLRKEVFDLTRDTWGFHISENEDKMRANFGPEIARVRNLIQQRMSSELNLHVLRTFQAAVAPGDPNYSAVAGVGLSDIDTALRSVLSETDLPREQVSIVGLPNMTQKIQDGLINLSGGGAATAFLPETNEAIIQRGGVARYKGHPIVELRNFKDEWNRSFFPANELWVVAQDSSKFAFWGAPLAKEFVEQDNWFWHYLQRRDFGGIVYRPLRLYRLVDTDEDE